MQNTFELGLIHCVYVSSALEMPTEADLTNLVAKARENNSRLAITGMLVYLEGSLVALFLKSFSDLFTI